MAPHRTHPHLYEINTWAWLEELTHTQGKPIRLGNVPDEEWDSLQAKGFDVIWLMGVWARSPESRRIATTEPNLRNAYDTALPGWTPEDIVGSPYAVQAYEPDPRIGSWKDLTTIRRKLHQRGIQLILDFVPNHTARDHPWIQTNPDFYIQAPFHATQERSGHFFSPPDSDGSIFLAHGKDPYFPPWTDTVQLNYFNPATQEAMLGELQKISAYCDGVRCDMAMLILNRIFLKTWGAALLSFSTPTQEFWSTVRQSLPNFTLIAEVYWDLEWELQQLGFDFTYDKRLYDRLRRSDAHGIRDHLAADLSFQNKLVRFIENHDEPRSAKTFGPEQLHAAVTVMGTLPGMRFYHQGQFEGKSLHLPVQLRRTKPETTVPHIREWHDRILKITQAPVFHDGNWQILQMQPHQDDSHHYLVAYSWQLNNDVNIVIVNMSHSPAQGLMVLPSPQPALAQDSSTYEMQDLLNGGRLHFTQQEIIDQSIPIHVKPYGSHVFRFQ